MESQVNVTLTALEPQAHIRPAQRVITLTPDKPSFPIGRASKSLSKGLLGERHNAWFESPVMSRQHAEVCYDIKEKVLTITDIGSMHGTHLNDLTLPPKMQTPLTNGDIVIFGAEVKRGIETFPACKFRINYELFPYRSANTFKYPESSDVEDGEDYELSEDESQLPQRPVSSDDEVAPAKPFLSANHFDIDLTRDDSPVGRHNCIIDLSEDVSAAPQDDQTRNAASKADAFLIDLVGNGSDEDDDMYSTDSDAPSLAGIRFDNRLSADVDEQEGEEEQSDEGDDDEVEYPMVDEDEQHVSIVKKAYSGNASRLPSFGQDLQVVLPLNGSTSKADNHITSEVSSEGESEVGLSEAGAEGFRALSDINMQNQENAHNGFAAHTVIYDNFTATSVPASAPAFKFPGNTEARLPQMGRQPSPSDAAMAKTFGQLSAQKLGDKSGKNAFFDAREINKARFNKLGSSAETCQGSSDRVNPHILWQTREPCSFLDNPAANIAPLREASPQPDMTSAVVYNNSKQSLAAAAAAAKHNRSGIKINDIIDTNLLQRSEGLKRKAEDISEAADDELKTWTNVPSAITASASAASTTELNPHTDVNDTAYTAGQVVPTLSATRPSKKRKLMEIIGYTAFGGVTIGAGVFAALVATAPTF